MLPERSFRQLLDELAAAPSAFTASDHFNELVFSLLRAMAQRDHRAPVERYNDRARAGLPGYLPDGVRDLHGPTAVSVAFLRSNTESDRDLLLATATRAASDAARVGIGRLLLIHNQVFPSPVNLDALPGGPQLVIWDARELEAVAEAEPATWVGLSQRLLLKSARESIGASRDWSAQAQGALADLKATYARDGVTLLLGAGVSSASGLPGWDALIGGLFAVAFADRLGTSLDADQSLALSQAAADLNSHSPLQTARYLRSALTDTGGGFEDQLTSVLYARSREKPNALLDAVAALCIPGRERAHVHAVITYNFDDLLEEALNRIPVRNTSIFYDHGAPEAASLGIYHVHGFLPRNRRGLQHLDESLVAFSEEVYHRLYVDPYHWTNFFQLNEFRLHTCVLVGLSLTDPNLRRLLDIAARGLGAPRHYALLKRVHDSDLLAQRDDVAAIPRSVRQQFLDIHHVVQENVLSSLGVRTIWLDSHDALVPALRGLRDF